MVSTKLAAVPFSICLLAVTKLFVVVVVIFSNAQSSDL